MLKFQNHWTLLANRRKALLRIFPLPLLGWVHRKLGQNYFMAWPRCKRRDRGKTEISFIHIMSIKIKLKDI
jgi:hypothetical protein